MYEFEKHKLLNPYRDKEPERPFIQWLLLYLIFFVGAILVFLVGLQLTLYVIDVLLN